jgi:hypothetical protein
MVEVLSVSMRVFIGLIIVSGGDVVTINECLIVGLLLLGSHFVVCCLVHLVRVSLGCKGNSEEA